MNYLRHILLFALLVGVVVTGLLWPRLPMANSQAGLNLVPRAGVDFSSLDVPLTAFEQRMLGEAEGIKRVILFANRVWHLAVTDGTRNRQAVHDPGYCFTGDGWTILGRERVPLMGGTAVLYSLVRAEEQVHALVWFAAPGGMPFASMPRYWWQSTLRRITRGLSGPEPLLYILRPETGPEEVPEDWKRDAWRLAASVFPHP